MTLSERAKKTRAILFDRYNQLNSLWEEAESDFTRGHIPRPVSFEFEIEEDHDEFGNPVGGLIHCLGLRKIKGKWRLCYGSYYMPHEVIEGPKWIPITESSGEDRIRAAPYLAQFREKVVNDTEAFVIKADEAISELKAAIESSKNDDISELLVQIDNLST